MLASTPTTLQNETGLRTSANQAVRDKKHGPARPGTSAKPRHPMRNTSQPSTPEYNILGIQVPGLSSEGRTRNLAAGFQSTLLNARVDAERLLETRKVCLTGGAELTTRGAIFVLAKGVIA